MRLRAALPVLLLAGAATSSGTTAASTPPWPSWLETAPVRNGAAVDAIYRSLLLERKASSFERDPKGLEEYKADEKRFRFDRAEFAAASGPFAGEWHFVDPGDQRWPRAAVRWTIAPSARYRVAAEIWCDGDAPACDEAQSWLRRLQAPRPVPDPAGRYSQWKTIALRETCQPQAPNTPPPRYPPEEDRRGIGGTAIVGVFFNACGEVRDAWIVRSTGNRNLDRSAVIVARRWRITPPASRAKGGDATVSIEFIPKPTS